MAAPVTTTRFRLNDVRVDWPELFKGKQFNGTGMFRCGAQLIVPPDHPQFKTIENAIVEAANAKFKDKASANLKACKSKDTLCWRDGDVKASKSDGYAGNFYLSANCKGGETEPECVKPAVYGPNRELITREADSPIYRGCFVNAVIEVYGDDRFGLGIYCKLVGIQFARDGEAFGSAPARADDFEVMSGAEELF